jgi:CubicO group peptidase (beta-lactamase class C family)
MSVAVLKGQHVAFANGFGYADIENQIYATENTPYYIASLTKPFGAAILMCLVEEGRVNLDEVMRDLLKESYFEYGRHTAQGYEDLCKKLRKLAWRYGDLLWDYRCDSEKITVRHHLTHTSQGKPADRYHYNGFLYSFLSNVAEEASGKNFDELLVEKIIAPLGMTNTVPSITETDRSRILRERAKSYRMALWGFVPSNYEARVSASAGTVSTVMDLAKFDVAMDQNRILSRESKETMFTPMISNGGKTLPYGLGWFVQEYRGLKILWDYGYAPGACSSLIVKIPAKELTMILLANSDGASRNHGLGAGDVFTSPFAALFVRMFVDAKTAA